MTVYYKNETKCAEYNKGHDIRDHKKVALGAPKVYTIYGGRGYAIYQKIYSRKKQEIKTVARRLAIRSIVTPNA